MSPESSQRDNVDGPGCQMADYRIEIIPTRQELAGACAFLMRLASDAGLPAMYRI
jgi:hypothetical protein